MKPKRNKFVQMVSLPDKGVNIPRGISGVLSKLFRQMLIDKKVELSEIFILLNKYIENPRNGVPQNIKDRTIFRSNLIKEFSKEKMTWKNFCKCLPFLGFMKVTFIIRGTHFNGSVTEHSTSFNFGNVRTVQEFEADFAECDDDELPTDLDD